MTFIDLDGEIDALGEGALSEAYADAAQSGPDAIVLNFENVGFINSTGIALVVGVLMKARAANIRIVTTGLSDHFSEIFRITRLSDYMTMLPSEESVIQELSTDGSD